MERKPLQYLPRICETVRKNKIRRNFSVVFSSSINILNRISSTSPKSNQFQSCRKSSFGKLQSPIALVEWNSTPKKSKQPLVFVDYDKTFPAIIQHTKYNLVQLTLKTEEAPPEIHGEGLEGGYVFAQMHYHWPAEHLMNGRLYDLEVHMLHYAKKYNDVRTALKHKDGIAVLGILCERSDVEHSEFNKIVASVSSVKDAGDEIVEIEPVALSKFVPENVRTFYRYDGSTTSPNYNEVVRWTVFLETLKISESQYEKLTDIYNQSGTKMISTNRSLKAWENHEIIAYNFE